MIPKFEGLDGEGFWSGGEGPVDRRGADPKFPSDPPDAPAGRLKASSTSYVNKHWGAAKTGTTPSGSSKPNPGPFTDHFAFKLGNCGHDVEGEAPDARAGVDAIPQAHEVHAPAVELVEGDDEVPHGAGEAVEPRNGDQAEATRANVVHEAIKLGSTVTAAADRPVDELPDDLPSALQRHVAELVDLGLRMLIRRGAARVEGRLDLRGRVQVHNSGTTYVTRK